jgi:hypothetical protein
MSGRFISFIRPVNFLPATVVALWIAAVSVCGGQTLTWSNPQGTISLFGGGPLTTILETHATLLGVEAADVLKYLDSPSIPAISRAEAFKDEASFAAIGQLSVTESEESGLPFAEGNIAFVSTGDSVATGSGTIHLSYLISVPDPAMIEFTNVRSTITTSGSPQSAFTLNLYESDATGAKVGGALLAFEGEYFDAFGSWESSVPYYLVEMNVSAVATLEEYDSVAFSYFVNLAPVSVPEPNAVALLLAGAMAVLVGARIRHRHSATKHGS